MSVTPSYVILPTDVANTGKNVDNVQLTNENSVVVQRQVTVIGDAQTATNRQSVNSNGGAGVNYALLSASQLTAAIINTSASGLTALAPATAGKSNKLYRIILFVGGATNITFEDASTPLSGPIPLQASGSIILDLSGDPWFTAATGDALNINSSNAVQLSGVAYYAQV